MSAKKDSRQAWDAFWEANTDASGSARGGCLPDAWQGIDQVQTDVWSAFANKLPRGVRVIDLGTGDGRVMAKLLAARRDLKPVGIDQASELPTPPRGAKVRAGVLMRDLPFPDEIFAAATSQFGFEYGDIAGAAAEVARVLKPGGIFGAITHRTDSPILAHNRKRRQQIAWAIEEQDLPGIAKRSLQLRQMGIATVPPEVATAPEEGARKFGPESAAWEIAEALRRTLHFGRNDPPAHTAAVIDQIVGQAQNELGRIASLEMAAEAAGTGEKLVAVLEAAGLELSSSEELRDGAAATPFATFLTLTKPE
ncbi:class I SAM-dependent methyltransferase [Aurantiacibacter sp. MUD11]|uniref:class I SAM-dependent methyltransferase n=1 Tax=Aurantiacibacter sp. MUD11 TaxID=3003265 RepID=UPI0022AA4723|nr:class I SAM-dependent methyltransferase [Aurantiacibacter sp. MUD11]WAT18129.1 class I SAM-dependent methyltransferase [Aurantiacibacter sp. MUD11]